MLASYKQEETTSVTNGTNGAIGLVHFSIESYEDDLVQFWSVTATSLILKVKIVSTRPGGFFHSDHPFWKHPLPNGIANGMTHWGPWLCKVIKLRLHLRLLWSKTGIENCWQFCRKLKHLRKSKSNGSFFTPISPPWYFRSKAWLCFNRIIIFQSFSSLPSFWIHVHVWFFGCVALRLVWTPCFNPSQGQAQEARCQNDDMFGQALILKKGRNTAICLEST